MPDLLATVDAGIDEAGKAFALLGKKKTAQIGAQEERAHIKAVCLSWLATHRMQVAPYCDLSDLIPIDGIYQALLEANEGRPSRPGTRDQLKSVKTKLISLRSKLVMVDPSAATMSDQPPQFSNLAPDPDMQAILLNRWNETILCMNGGANLAAIVMMGGLLEALLLARINLESNKAPIFKATKAPRAIAS